MKRLTFLVPRESKDEIKIARVSAFFLPGTEISQDDFFELLKAAVTQWV